LEAFTITVKCERFMNEMVIENRKKRGRYVKEGGREGRREERRERGRKGRREGGKDGRGHIYLLTVV
jgi:hypothetical protein